MTGLLSGLGVALVVGLLAGRGSDAAPTPPRPDAVRTFHDLELAVARHDPDAAAALAAPGDWSVAARLAGLVDNAAAAHLVGVGFTPSGARGTVDGGVWREPVTTTWRIWGFDAGPARAEVTFELRRFGDRVAIAGIGGGAGPTPVWMAGPIRVRRTATTMVLVAPGAGRPAAWSRLARRAAGVAGAAITAWRPRLVVEVPRNAAGLDRALGAGPGEYAALAAVTATADASGADSAPVHVLVNPEQLARLGRTAARVVLSHEAAHVALGAATSDLPLWLVEGTADQVALRDLPGERRRVRARLAARDSASDRSAHLPGAAAFTTSGARLESAYESAWLACQLLARRGGERALLGLYRAMEAGAPLRAELRHRFGWRPRAFVRLWADERAGVGLSDSAP